MLRITASWNLAARLLGAAVLFGAAALPITPAAAQYTVISKSCDSCGGAVSINSQIGDTCPHCGVTWGYEKHQNGGSYGASTARAPRRKKARQARKPRKVTPQGRMRPFYRTMERGYRQRSVNLVTGHWAPDFRTRELSGSVSGRHAELRDLQRSFRQSETWSVTFDLLGARDLTGGRTEVWVRRRTRMAAGAVTAHGTFTEHHVWKRVDGKWRLQSVKVVKSHA